MKPLHRLPNGEWTDLKLVSNIMLKAATSAPFSGPAMVKAFTPNVEHVLLFGTNGDAQAYADELAAMVNEARKENLNAV